MSFMEEMVGFERRVVALVNFICVILGGVFAVFSLVSVVVDPYRIPSYAGVGAVFLLFPIAASFVFPDECCSKMPPPLLKPKAKKR